MAKEKSAMDSKLGWQALITINLMVYLDISIENLLRSLFTSPGYVNASKAVLTICGMGPLEFDGQIDEAFCSAIRALALAAGVDPETGVLPESSVGTSSTEDNRPGDLAPTKGEARAVLCCMGSS
jgi:hypothetical protein